MALQDVEDRWSLGEGSDQTVVPSTLKRGISPSEDRPCRVRLCRGHATGAGLAAQLVPGALRRRSTDVPTGSHS